MSHKEQFLKELEEIFFLQVYGPEWRSMKAKYQTVPGEKTDGPTDISIRPEVSSTPDEVASREGIDVQSLSQRVEGKINEISSLSSSQRLKSLKAALRDIVSSPESTAAVPTTASGLGEKRTPKGSSSGPISSVSSISLTEVSGTSEPETELELGDEEPDRLSGKILRGKKAPE